MTSLGITGPCKGRRGLARGFAPLCLSLLACTPGTEPAVDAGPIPSLTVLSPLPGAILTAADDLDADAEGLQIDVLARLDPPEAVSVQLTVDGSPALSASGEQGQLVFSRVTLSSGPGGIEHALSLTAEGMEEVTWSVLATTATASGTPSCDFLLPEPVASSPVHIVVGCRNVPLQSVGTLTISDVDDAQVGPVYEAQLDDNLRFVTDVALAAGTYGLGFALAGVSATAEIVIEVGEAQAPILLIDAISDDDVLGTAELSAPLVVSGSSVGLSAATPVSVVVGDTALEGTVSDAGIWSVTLEDPSSLSGTVQVTADATDENGVAASQATRTLVIDTVAPTVNLAPVAGDDVINAAEAAAVTVTGTTTGVANGQRVTLRFATVDETFTAEVQESAWSIDLAAGLIASLPGSETLTVDVSDLAGNPAATVERIIGVDLVLPSVSVVTADPLVVGTLQDDDADPGILTTVDVEVAGLPAGALVSVFTGSAKVGEQALAAAVADDELASVTVPVRLFATGAYSVSVSDAAGNESTALFDVQVNTALYACELTSPAPTAGSAVVNQGLDVEAGGDAQAVFSFSCPGLPGTASASLMIAGADSGTTATITAADPAVVTFPAVTLADGSTTTVALEVSDANTAGGSSSYTMVVDVTAPTVTVTSSEAALSVGETAVITISLSGADEVLTSGDVSAIGGTLSGFFGSGSSYQVVLTPTSGSIADAVVTVAAGSVSDAAGNGNAPATLTLPVDTIAPAVAITGISDDSSTPGDFITNDTQLVFGGTAEASSNVLVVLSQAGTEVFSTTVTADGTTGVWSVDRTAAASLSDGTYALTAVATDAAGNSASAQQEVVIDSIAPTVTLTSSAAALSVGETAVITISLSGADEVLTSGDVSATGGTLSGFFGSGSSYQVVLTPTSGSTADAVVTVAAGSVSDAAGNGNVLATLTLPVDTIAPAVAITSITDDSGTGGDFITNDTQLVFSGTAEASSSVLVVLSQGGTEVFSTPVTADGTTGAWSVDRTTEASLSEGTYALTAVATDAAGNSASAQQEVVIDQLPPQISLFRASLSETANDAARLGIVDIELVIPAGSAAIQIAATHTGLSADASFAAISGAPLVATDMERVVEIPVAGNGGDFVLLETGSNEVPPLWFGPHTWTLYLRATDDAGNVSTATTTVQFDITFRSFAPGEDDTGDGSSVDDEFGAALSSARGDLNGDGIEDLVVGAWNEGADCIDGFCNGALYVLYGQSSAAALGSQAPQVIRGAAGETLGYEVAIVPSIDGDGSDDLLVNAFDALAQSAVYIYRGTTDGSEIANRPVATISEDVPGLFNAFFGSRLTGVGDVNGDGIGDWLAGDHDNAAAPVSYLFFGDAALQTCTEATCASTRASTADVTLQLPAADNSNSSGAASLGDLNGDGIGDFAVGAAYISGDTDGRIYVLHGRGTWPAAVTLDAVSSPDFVLDPQGLTLPNPGRFGVELSVADINGDGDADLIAKGDRHALVFLHNGTTLTSTGNYLFKTDFAATFGPSGVSVGDINGDGFADVMLSNVNRVSVYLGDARTSGDREVPSITYPTAPGEYFRIAMPGDLDDDGFDDLAFAGPSGLELRYGPVPAP